MKRLVFLVLACSACTTAPPTQTLAPAVAEAKVPVPTETAAVVANAEPAAKVQPPTEVTLAERLPTAAHRAIVDAADRLPEDRELDAGRKPAELLAFLDLRPGMKVAELQAGFGYTTELMARAVGPEGVVYAQNNRFVIEKFLEPHWTKRLQRPAMKNVVRLDTELDAPFPSNVGELDAVIMVLFYHDTYWQKTDRAAMNAAVLAALKPGGSFIIIDHSGAAGSGSTGAQTLHRVEEELVRTELEAAGFRLAERAEFLRNPDDRRDWNASPKAASEAGLRGTSDRFVLRFVKP